VTASAGRWTAATSVVLALFFVAPAPARGEGGVAPDAGAAAGTIERELLADYQRDPSASGRALLRLGGGSIEGMPVVLLLAMADVHLRAGRVRSATRFFQEVAARDAGAPWAGLADLGLGWAALVRGRYQDAEAHYGRVAEPRDLAAIARVLGGWATAMRGRSGEAVAALDPVVSGGAVENVRAAAILGAGYARFWEGSYDEAATTWQRMSVIAPSSRLADDARYAAAWAQLRAGNRSHALAELAALAASAPSDPASASIPRARLELVPRSVLRVRNPAAQDLSTAAAPDVRMVAMLDADGRALARAALALVGGPDAPAPEGGSVELAAPAPRDTAPRAAAPRAPKDGRRNDGTVRRARFAWLLGGLAVVLGVVLLVRRRPGSRTA